MALYEDERFWKRRPRASSKDEPKKGGGSSSWDETPPIEDKPSIAESIWRGLPINPYYWKSTEEKAKALREDYAKEHGIHESLRFDEKGNRIITIGPQTEDLKTLPQLNQYPEGIGYKENESPGEKFIMDWIAQNTIPGGAIRNVLRVPLSAIEKIPSKVIQGAIKKAVESKGGKIVSKVLDYTVGKLDNSAPPIVNTTKNVGKDISKSKLNLSEQGGIKVPREEPRFSEEDINVGSKFIKDVKEESTKEKQLAYQKLMKEQRSQRSSDTMAKYSEIKKSNPEMSEIQAFSKASKETAKGEFNRTPSSIREKYDEKSKENLKNLIIRNLTEKFKNASSVDVADLIKGHTQTIDRILGPNGHASEADLKRLEFSIPKFAQELRAEQTKLSIEGFIPESGGPRVMPSKKIDVSSAPVAEQPTMGGMGLPKTQNVYTFYQIESRLLKEYPGLSYEDAARIARGKVDDVEKDALLAGAKGSGPPVTQVTTPKPGFGTEGKQLGFPEEALSQPKPVLGSKPSTLTGTPLTGDDLIKSQLAVAKMKGQINPPPVTKVNYPETQYVQKGDQLTLYPKETGVQGSLISGPKDIPTVAVTPETRTPEQLRMAKLKFTGASGQYPKPQTLAQKVKDFYALGNYGIPKGAETVKGKVNPVKPAYTAKQKAGNVLNTIVDVLGIPKTLISSYDLSIPGRQALIWGFGHPIAWAKQWKPMMKALESESFALAQHAKVMNDSRFAEAISKGWINPSTPIKGGRYNQRIESFASDMAEKWIPGVRPSQRAATTFLEQGMYDTWIKGYTVLKKLNAPEAAYKTFGQILDASMGQRPFPFNQFINGKFLNNLLFSPKLMWSRLSYPVFAAKGMLTNSYLRKEAIKTAVGGLIFGSSVLGLYRLINGKGAELDPRGTEFGKLKWGDTRLDPWGGYAQYARFAAQFIMGEKKTSTGEIVKVNKGDLAWRFGQSKSGVLASLIQDLVVGEDFMGNKLEWTKESIAVNAYNRMCPLSVQDLADAYNQNGIAGLAHAAPGLVGVGVVTYNDPAAKLQDALAMDYSKGDKLWSDLKGLEQQKLLVENPQLQQLKDESFQKFASTREGKKSVEIQYQQAIKANETTFNKSVLNATIKFRQSGNKIQYKEDINEALRAKRDGWDDIGNNRSFDDVSYRIDRPLTEAQKAVMQPEDVLRVMYNQAVYGPNNYDEFGDYDFTQAEKSRQEFISQYGQKAVDYVEAYQDAKVVNQPQEYQALVEAKKTLAPYWKLETDVWSKYDPKAQVAYARIKEKMNSSDLADKKEVFKVCKQYPVILKAIEEVSFLKKKMEYQKPEVREALKYYW